MPMIEREKLLFWWWPTLRELQRSWPDLSENDAIAAVEECTYFLAVVDTPDLDVWVMRV